jgi:hypothetical protein
MLTGMFRKWVHADPGVVWGIMLDSVENPQRYVANVDACRVLERHGGGVIKELRVGYETAPGVFDFFVFDRWRLREVKSTDTTAEPVYDVFRLFTFESTVVREVTVQGVRYREKILISREEREIRRELMDHPTSEGKMAIRVVPISVQNPMAPVNLQFQSTLAPRVSRAGECAQWHEETLLAIREEQRCLKVAAEERERVS